MTSRSILTWVISRLLVGWTKLETPNVSFIWWRLKWTVKGQCFRCCSFFFNRPSTFTRLRNLVLAHQVAKFLCLQGSLSSYASISKTDSLWHLHSRFTPNKTVLETTTFILHHFSHECVKIWGHMLGSIKSYQYCQTTVTICTRTCIWYRGVHWCTWVDTVFDRDVQTIEMWRVGSKKRDTCQSESILSNQMSKLNDLCFNQRFSIGTSNLSQLVQTGIHGRSMTDHETKLWSGSKICLTWNGE